MKHRVVRFFCDEKENHLPHPQKEYNAALRQRGSLTFWISDEAVQNWTANEKTGLPGASPTYTDLAIETMATVQAIYHLAGRQTQGLLQSVFALLHLDLTAPDHSTLSRRRGQLTISLPVQKRRHATSAWTRPG